MDKKIRDAIDRSLHELKDIQDKVDDFIDDLPDDVNEIKSTTKNALHRINELLSKAAEQAGDHAEEAQLQAHLGLMEAQDKLEASKVVVDDYVARASKESRTLLDEVELKHHLAMMEAKDFWEKRGPELTEEFRQSASDMQNLAEKAVDELQTVFSRWNEQFKKGQ